MVWSKFNGLQLQKKHIQVSHTCENDCVPWTVQEYFLKESAEGISRHTCLGKVREVSITMCSMICGSTVEVWQEMMGDVIPAVDLSANLTWRAG
jgi:hypothetical protein